MGNDTWVVLDVGVCVWVDDEARRLWKEKGKEGSVLM